MRFGDKFFLIWFFMVLESYEPTNMDILLFAGLAFFFAATWEYFHDLAIFQVAGEEAAELERKLFLLTWRIQR